MAPMTPEQFTLWFRNSHALIFELSLDNDDLDLNQMLASLSNIAFGVDILNDLPPIHITTGA